MNGQLRGLVLVALIAGIGPPAFAADGQNGKPGPAAKKPAGGAKPAGNRPAGPANVRPNDKPQLNRPTGAAKPPANTMEKVKPQPGGNRPGNLPANGGKPIAKPDIKPPDKGNKLPNKDNMVGNRPGTRPGEMGDKHPGRPDNRPPSLGGNVGDKPTTLPAPIPSFPTKATWSALGPSLDLAAATWATSDLASRATGLRVSAAPLAISPQRCPPRLANRDRAAGREIGLHLMN
jgi:hypothetical protein